MQFLVLYSRKEIKTWLRWYLFKQRKRKQKGKEIDETKTCNAMHSAHTLSMPEIRERQEENPRQTRQIRGKADIMQVKRYS